MRPLQTIVGAAAIAILPSLALAAQNDFFPTDFVALSGGKMNVSVYAAYQSLNGPWKDGTRQTYASDLKTNLVAVRASRMYSFGDNGQYTTAPVAVLTTADAQAQTPLSTYLGKSASGIGDLRLGTAFWFHVDRVNRDYALASLFVSLPTGDYSEKQTLNIGENRVKGVLSLGWMKTLAERWVLEVSPEIAFFGNNDRYYVYPGAIRRLSQDVAYAATGSLRYKFTPTFHGYASAQVNRGGATQLNGQAYNGAPENTRLALGALLFTGDSSQLQLRYAQDVDAKNGFRNDGEVTLRWSVYFN